VGNYSEMFLLCGSMQHYPELNFPPFEHKTKQEAGITYIWEPIRKIWLVMTSEEWVRQNLIRYFVDVLAYPMGLMQSECKVKVGKLTKRFDLVVMDKNLKPWLICECKGTEINIDNTTLQQAGNYNSQLKCPYLAVTNGMKHFCFQISFTEGNFKPLKDFPTYEN
jgi:hypothetical protein